MNARVIHTADTGTIATGRMEHISMESEPEALAPSTPRPRRKVRSSYRLRSRLRGCETEVAILEDHYISVRSVRPHTEPKKYELDLRFANPKPVRVRYVSWFWLALAASLGLLAGGALWSLWPAHSRWLNPFFLTAVVTLIASLGAVFMFLRRTIESLEFTSVHGGVTLLSVSGGIGSARAGRKFFVELIKNINAAKATRQQPRQQLLRDEMREHHRLRELGVLTEDQYEASKMRILAAH